MSKIVNLRTIRKQRSRDAARRKGTESATASGETRAEREARRAEAARSVRHLDNHRRGDPDPEA